MVTVMVPVPRGMDPIGGSNGVRGKAWSLPPFPHCYQSQDPCLEITVNDVLVTILNEKQGLRILGQNQPAFGLSDHFGDDAGILHAHLPQEAQDVLCIRLRRCNEQSA